MERRRGKAKPLRGEVARGAEAAPVRQAELLQQGAVGRVRVDDCGIDRNHSVVR